MDILLFILLVIVCTVVMAAVGAVTGTFIGFHVAKWRGVPTMEGQQGLAAVFGGGVPGLFIGLCSGWFVARWLWGG